jgi:hypothetical protein
MAQSWRAAPGGDIAHTCIKDRLKQDRRCRRAIANCVMNLPEHLAHEHCADIIIPVRQLNDASGDHRAIVQEFGLFVLLK